jgi:predicted N-formylglutamate amidohydrolase
MMRDPPAVEIANPAGTSPFVLLCEHASNRIPEEYDGLGLSAADRARHIAWDIGAADVARSLSALIDAPLILSGYSRLLIDCNRPLHAATSIPEISETTVIPGNAALSPVDRRRRAERFFGPFQAAVEAHLDHRRRGGRRTVVIGIHSFTPVFKGFRRPWHAGILFRRSRDFGRAFVDALRRDDFVVEANQPYQIGDDTDYTVPMHGERRGLDAALVEIRQDLVADPRGAGLWAGFLAAALAACR